MSGFRLIRNVAFHHLEISGWLVFLGGVPAVARTLNASRAGVSPAQPPLTRRRFRRLFEAILPILLS
jgi:hypothetical protein